MERSVPCGARKRDFHGQKMPNRALTSIVSTAGKNIVANILEIAAPNGVYKEGPMLSIPNRNIVFARPHWTSVRNKKNGIILLKMGARDALSPAKNNILTTAVFYPNRIDLMPILISAFSTRV